MPDPPIFLSERKIRQMEQAASLPLGPSRRASPPRFRENSITRPYRAEIRRLNKMLNRPGIRARGASMEFLGLFWAEAWTCEGGTWAISGLRDFTHTHAQATQAWRTRAASWRDGSSASHAPGGALSPHSRRPLSHTVVNKSPPPLPDKPEPGRFRSPLARLRPTASEPL